MYRRYLKHRVVAMYTEPEKITEEQKEHMRDELLWGLAYKGLAPLEEPQFCINIRKPTCIGFHHNCYVTCIYIGKAKARKLYRNKEYLSELANHVKKHPLTTAINFYSEHENIPN